MKKINICISILVSIAVCAFTVSCISLGGAYTPSAAELQIYTAVMQNNIPMTENLLKNGAPPNARGVSSDALLHTAVRSSNVEMIDLLLKYKADINITNKDGYTPLDLALKPAAVKKLIENGADITHTAKNKQNSPFESWCTHFSFVTSEADKKQTFDIMAQQNLPVNREDYAKRYFINRSDLVEIIKLYQNAGYDINSSFKQDKSTPIIIAAQNDNYQLMHVLMEAGAKAGPTHPFGDDPLNIITRNKDSKKTAAEYAAVVKALLKYGADINAKDYKGNPPLCNAALIDSAPRVKVLLALPDIRVNEKGSNGGASLSKTNSLTVAKDLVAAGSDIEQENDGGGTPIFSIRNPDVVRYLLKIGANLHHLDKEKNNVLLSNLFAAYAEFKTSADDVDVEIRWAPKIQVLIDAGIDVNYTSPNKITALTVASRVPFEKIVAALKKAGAR